ncbi:Dor1-like family-domain-containing protein [Scleroderma yunnanense]
MTAEPTALDSELISLQDLLSLQNGPIEFPGNGAYLVKLSSLPLSDLLAAPTVLSTQSHTLTSSLTALTHASYPTLLSLHKSSTALLDSLSSLDFSLNTLLNSALPALDDAAHVFHEKSGPSVIEERQKTRVVLEQQDKLRDLLDIPVLIDTCVRNGLYAEALTLAAHASTVLKTLSTVQSKEAVNVSSSLQLAQSLQAEVTSSLHSMRLLLLTTLFEPSRKLPALWKAVQFLRRMQAMSEDELALTFASARIDCLRSALQNVERDSGVSATASCDVNDTITGTTSEERESELDRQGEDIARFLKKYIDVWREGAYDITIQYTTIFLERSHHLTSTAPSSASLPAPLNLVIKQTLVPTLLSLLLPSLRIHLRRAYPHLAPLAAQLAYCSSAMARIGMDFRALLSPLITQAVIDGFTRDIQIGAEREWNTLLSKHVSSKSRSTAPSAWLTSPAHPIPPISSLFIPPSTLAHVPPQILTSFPPLAISLNTYLRALNRLRSLAPMNALNGIIFALESDLSQAGKSLFAYAKGCEDGDQRELEVLGSMGTAYTRIMVPFLKRAVIEGVFGIPYDEPLWRNQEGIREMDGSPRSKEASALDTVLRSWESWLEDRA